MDIKIVEEKMLKAISDPEEEKLVQEYIEDYVSLLEEYKITQDTANVAIKGIDLDGGANILDAFAGIDKKEVQSSWKTIKECDAFKLNEGNNALKLTCAFAYSALCGESNAASIIGNIFISLVMLTKGAKDGETNAQVYQIIRDYLIKLITKENELPEWESIKISPDNAIALSRLMLNSLNEVPEKDRKLVFPAFNKINRWILNIKEKAEEEKIIKDLEKNKPPKKSEELRALADHFKLLEDELDKAVMDNAKLTIDKKKLQDEISDLEVLKRALTKKIEDMEDEIEALNTNISKANQEVDERKKLNEAQVQYREESQASMLDEIARALKAEYGDFAETKDTPMSEMLGEIYREKLNQIFKILDQKGIKVKE